MTDVVVAALNGSLFIGMAIDTFTDAVIVIGARFCIHTKKQKR